MAWHPFEGDRDWYDDDLVVAHCPCGDRVPIVPSCGDEACETCGREYRNLHGDTTETRGEGNGATYTPTHGYSSIYMVCIG